MATGGGVSGVKTNLKTRCSPLMWACHHRFSISNSITKCLCELARKLNSLSQICFAFKTLIILKFHCTTDAQHLSFSHSIFWKTYKSSIGGETGPTDESKRAKSLVMKQNVEYTVYPVQTWTHWSWALKGAPDLWFCLYDSKPKLRKLPFYKMNVTE